MPGTALSAKDGVVTRIEKGSTFSDLTIGRGWGRGRQGRYNEQVNESEFEW